MDNQLTVEDFMLEQVADYLDAARQEIVTEQVLTKLDTKGSVTKEQKQLIEAIVEEALIEMSESLLPEQEDLVITESDYMLTEEGELYFTEGTDLELIATDVILEAEEGEKEETKEDEKKEDEKSEDACEEKCEEECGEDDEKKEGDEDKKEEVVTESTNYDEVDTIVASVMKRIRGDV